MYTIFHWIYAIQDIQIFFKSKQSVHIMYTISCSIYSILDVQFLFKSRKSIYLIYTNSSWIYAIQDIQIFFKSRQSIHIMYLISYSIYSILDVQFSANPEICTSNVHIIQLNLHNSGLIFLQIQAIRAHNVHNFLFNLCYSGF